MNSEKMNDVQQTTDPLIKFKQLALKAKKNEKKDKSALPKSTLAYESTQNMDELSPLQSKVVVVNNNNKPVDMTPRMRVWTECRRFYRRFGLKHFGFTLVIIAYSFLGGYIFSKLELDNELKLKRDKNSTLIEEAQKFADEIWLIVSRSNFRGQIDGSEANFKRIVNDKMVQYQVDHKMYPDDKITWDFWGGMFFAGTVYTTIGYGHYFPVTFYGRIAVMLYALFGIPMLLTLLADMGKLLTQFLNRMYTVFRLTLARVLNLLWRKKFEMAVTKAKMTEFDFPIALAAFFIVAWIFFCSSLFCLWETTWTYFDAFYFFFISLSTATSDTVTLNLHNENKKCLLSGRLIIEG